MKVTIEEADRPERFSADLAGKPVTGIDIFCADPLPPRYEINFDVPRDTRAGRKRASDAPRRAISGFGNPRRYCGFLS